MGRVCARDLLVSVRQGGSTSLVVAFFVVTVTLFPFGVGPEPGVLERIASGVLFVAALLAALLSLDRLFQADFEDGTLEQLLMADLPMELTVLAKVLAHWLTTGVPLLVAAPLLAVLLHTPADGLGVLLLAMALATPALSLIGAVGAALTVGVRRGGALLSLLVLPLYIPVLIFAVGAVEAHLAGLEARPHLLILASLQLGAWVLSPWAAAAALRLALE